jgi:predicted nuclease of predicted toxin-antitoxin system
MNVLLDAHLPRRLVSIFRTAGHDAIHSATAVRIRQQQDA